jgi:uncharacterized membrane protein HdeD (DUF308 family)
MPFPGFGIVREGLAELRAAWCWFVSLGVALVLVGVIAMAYAGIATITTALVFGYLMLAAGVCYVVGAFFTRRWGGFFLSLLAGVLHLAVGLIVVDRPVEAVLVYTLVMAVFFFVEGLLRIIGAVIGRFEHWVLMFCSGLVTLLLGVMIWRQWPFSGLYVVGLFVGINLVLHGASFVSIGLAARRLPVSGPLPE